jgi:hypothetical protein
MKAAISILSMLAIGIAILGLSPAQEPRVTKDQAIIAARKFLELANLPAPAQSPRIRTMGPTSIFKDEWMVIFPGEYNFYVRQADGVVSSFTNNRRIDEQFRRTQDRSHRRFTTVAQAKPYTQALGDESVRHYESHDRTFVVDEQGGNFVYQ